MNNATMPSADRGTHLKVVAVSLAASILILGIAIGARTTSPDTVQTARGPVVKATKTVITTSNDVSTIR